MALTHGSLALSVGQEPFDYDPAWAKAQEARNYCKDEAFKMFTKLGSVR